MKRSNFEEQSADPIDPAKPREDLDATLSETSLINDHLKVVQGRPEHVSDLGVRQAEPLTDAELSAAAAIEVGNETLQLTAAQVAALPKP